MELLTDIVKKLLCELRIPEIKLTLIDLPFQRVWPFVCRLLKLLMASGVVCTSQIDPMYVKQTHTMALLMDSRSSSAAGACLSVSNAHAQNVLVC